MRKAVLAAISVLAFVACGQDKTQEQTAQVAEVIPQVRIQAVSKEIVPQTQVYSTTVQANITNNIAPQSGNRIQKIYVEIGDYVNAGQILAEMDRVQLDQAELKLANQDTELERISQLYEEGGVSKSDYDAAVLAAKVSKSSYENLEQNTILRSPVSGVITARNYDQGDMYAMASPIFTVQQITPVKVLVAVSETDYTKVKKGDSVTLTVDALPGQTFTGRVIRLYPVMDAASHTFNVEVQFANERRALRPGMFARAEVNFGNNNSITVPDDCVLKLQGAGQRSVFCLAADGTAKSKVVVLGRHFEGKYEILSGLEEGDKVIVKGHSALKAGQKVEVTE